MERGVDPNEARTDGWRPLSIALYAGREQEAFFLINEAPSVDIEAPILRGDTPLMLAAELGRVNVLRALVAKGANVNVKNEDGYSALEVAIRHGQRAAAVCLINEAPGVDIDARDGHNRTALVLAAAIGDVAVMKALVAKGADVNTREALGLTPLRTAISHWHEEAALYLVEEPPVAVYEPDACASRGALGLAATSLYRVMRAIVRRMRAEGLDSATVASEMGAAAHSAISMKKLEALKALVEEGLDVDQAHVVVKDWKTNDRLLLHQACVKGDREAATLLVERGCDPLAHNSHGHRAHHVLAAQEDGLPMLHSG